MKLILLGASDSLIDAMDDEDIPFEIAKDALHAFDLLCQAEEMVALGYCEATFGFVVSGQLVKLAEANKTFVLLEDASVYSEQETIVLQAANTLNADAVLDMSIPRAVDWLRAALDGPITHSQIA